MDFTPGLLQGEVIGNREAARQQAIQSMLFETWRQQQLRDQLAREQQARAGMVQQIAQQPQQPLAPPPQAPVQAPPPGQSSQPMLPPQPPSLGQAAAQSAMAPPPPQGWMASRSAPPELGGAPPSKEGAGLPPPPPPAGQAAMGTGSGWVKQTVDAMTKQNIPPGQIADVLEQMYPYKQQEASENYKQVQLQLREQDIGIKAAMAAIAKYRADTQRSDEESKDERRKASATNAENVLEARRSGEYFSPRARSVGGGGGAAGGPGKLKSVEPVYPRREDGSIDDSKAPVGSRGINAQGKIVYLDIDGNEATEEALGLAGAGTAKEAKTTKVSVQNATRNRLVQGSAQNALARLDEIEKDYPNETTSLLFSTHPEGFMESAGAAAIRGSQGVKQQKVDSAWRSFIDEAIPVFTGGLRGSDAFRRFLISQAPNWGAKNNKQIIELFRKNIQGIDRAFANSARQAYANNPSYWAPGVTQKDVDEAMAEQGGSAGGGATQGWKVEKITPGK